MTHSSGRAVLTALAAAVLFALTGTLYAQAGYPNKPIKIIAPVQPGGGVDLVARTIADGSAARSASRSSSTTRAAAAVSSASMATARAAPDGYTLMVGYVGTHGTNPAVRKLPVRRDRISRRSRWSAARPTSWSCRRRCRSTR